MPGKTKKKRPAAPLTRFDRKLASILSAAAEEFAAEGYDRASIRGVARRAGVSVAGLYYYVRSKEELLFQIQYHVFDDLVADYLAKSEGIEDPEQRLELLVRRHLERFWANMAELTVCSRELDRLEGDLRRRVMVKQREYYNIVRRLFSELQQREGGDGGGVPPRTAALALFGSINWVFTWYRPERAPSASRMARDLLQIYLRGALPPRQAPAAGGEGAA